MPRYHHEVHHSKSESSMKDGAYAGKNATERMQHHDASMISEDHNAIANLPQQVIMKDWADHEAYLPDILDDTIVGINKQINYDDKKRQEHFEPKKV
ncbi:MAG: hypothetical protein ABSB40_12120 [Nitrososphaeria archaeon]